MPVSVLIQEFDTWQQGYAFASVTINIAGTATPALVYTDQALTQPAGNPQTLLSKTDTQGNTYGKFAVPLYTGQPYSLSINSVDRTGIVTPPLTTLVGQDGSDLTVIPTGASVAGNLDDILARRINVLDFGVFLAAGQTGASATTNTNTLNGAIGAAAGAGGGAIDIPDGLFQITSITLPQNVTLVGQGRNATTLQSTFAGKVVTIGGSQAGLKNLSLDGLNQGNGSIGLYAEMMTGVILDNVLVQRFATGIQLIGGGLYGWRELYISDCLIGYQGHGFSDSGNGGALEFGRWDGGQIDTCSTAGIEIENLDALCDHLRFSNLLFLNNTGIAFHGLGARATLLQSCSWNGNTTDLQIEDGSPINVGQTNTTIGFECRDGSFIGTGSNGAQINLKGTLKSVAFRRCEFTKETITITAPGNTVLAQDCRNIGGVTFGGNAQAWTSSFTNYDGYTVCVTNSATPFPAWEMPLDSGQLALVEISVVARSRTSTDNLWVKVFRAMACSGASLAYNAETAAFTAGSVVTGQTSQATGRATAVTLSGGSGTLTLQDVTNGPNGGFQLGEVITDSGGGHALVAAALAPGTVTAGNLVNTGAGLSADTGYWLYRSDSAWNVGLTGQGQNAVILVTGDTNTVEWFVNVRVLATAPIL
jgi:hypothetical protein